MNKLIRTDEAPWLLINHTLYKDANIQLEANLKVQNQSIL